MSDRRIAGDTGAYPACKSSWVMAPEDFCGQPATVPVTVGCVHEHVRDSAACPFHAENLDTHFCAACFDADGHRCPLWVQIGVPS